MWGAFLEVVPSAIPFGRPGPLLPPPGITGVASAAAEDVEFLKSIDGFEDLFGAQDYCRCEECLSVLSPAAYFVDLMQFIDVNIRKVVFIGAKANHALDLFQRRSDLWSLPLTCENTHTLVPYLQIVNEILERYLATKHALAGDPAIVVYGLLATLQRSIREPFILPLERLKLYLTFLESSRAGIARTMGAAEPVVTAAVLGLWPPTVNSSPRPMSRSRSSRRCSVRPSRLARAARSIRSSRSC